MSRFEVIHGGTAIHAWETDEEYKAVNTGTLTAEQVREAIFNNSIYASYDGVKYYADGISMQAIADELNKALLLERE